MDKMTVVISRRQDDGVHPLEQLERLGRTVRKPD
jgi:hypothetical protein